MRAPRSIYASPPPAAADEFDFMGAGGSAPIPSLPGYVSALYGTASTVLCAAPTSLSHPLAPPACAQTPPPAPAAVATEQAASGFSFIGGGAPAAAQSTAELFSGMEVVANTVPASTAVPAAAGGGFQFNPDVGFGGTAPPIPGAQPLLCFCASAMRARHWF